MGHSMRDSSVSGHRPLPEKTQSVAKVTLPSLRKPEIEDEWLVLVGEAVERIRLQAGLSLKEFAAALKKDERQVARWENGTEHAQFGVIFAVEDFRAYAVIALAEIAKDNVELITEIRVRRSA